MDQSEDIHIGNINKEAATIGYVPVKDIANGGSALTAIVRASDLRILFVNSQFEHYLGYTNSDVEQGNILFSSMLEKNHADRLYYQFNNVKDSVEARSRFMIYTLHSKDGRSIPFCIYIAPFESTTWSTNDAAYYLTMHPDLSKWDMPFTSFTTRELFLEQFTSEHFGTFEWIIDADKVFWSSGIYKIYEVDEEVKDMNHGYISSFTHPDDAQRVTEAMKAALSADTNMNIEFRLISAKNNIKNIHALARTVRNKEGKAIKFAGSIRDITDQRIIEENLKNKVEELNHSNRELTEFAYVASHDMQEPLRKITTFSDRLSEKYKDVLTGDGAMYLARMTASAENMRNLINDLLEFSRISKTILPYEPVDLNKVLQQVSTDLELIIEETGTVIHLNSLPLIDAVSSQMKQLFTNIINNAIKFHKENTSPVINIEAAILSAKELQQYDLVKSNNYYKIQITDNGIGFEEEYALRIFQVFQRLHGKSEYPGSGIGLAICKKILEYHNGIIYAENVPGTGARFVIIIPLHQPNAKQ